MIMIITMIMMMTIMNISATSHRGSAAEAEFTSAFAVASARLAVRRVQKRYHGDAAPWIDVKKTPQGMKPSRMMHKAYDALIDLAKAAGIKDAVQKDPMSRSLLLAGQKLGYSAGGTWIWKPIASTSVPKALLDTARRYAESI